MLLLSRRNHQGLLIEPDASIPADMTVGELFGENGIKIKIISIEDGIVKLGIDAPNEFKILRNELDNWNSESNYRNKKDRISTANIYRRRKTL